MRRIVLATALLVLSTALPVWAQHRGFGATPRGGVSIGVRPGGRVIFNSSLGFGFRGGFAFGHNPRVFFGSRRFFGQRRFFFPPSAFAFGYPYTAYPYYGLGLQSDFAYAEPTRQDQVYAEQNAALSNQVSYLQSELDQMRQEQASRADQIQYVSPALMQAPRPAASPVAKPEPEAAGPPTVLVFLDGHKEEVSNYAVVGRTLWIFSEQRARKLPLADLDLHATRDLNQERGIEFPRGNAGPAF